MDATCQTFPSNNNLFFKSSKGLKKLLAEGAYHAKQNLPFLHSIAELRFVLGQSGFKEKNKILNIIIFQFQL